MRNAHPPVISVGRRARRRTGMVRRSRTRRFTHATGTQLGRTSPRRKTSWHQPKIGYFYGSKTRERRPLPQHGMIKEVLFDRTYTTGNFGASRIEDGVKRELMSAQRSRITARRYSTVKKKPQNSPDLALWRSISQREPPSAPASFKPQDLPPKKKKKSKPESPNSALQPPGSR